MKDDPHDVSAYMPWWLGDYRRDTADLTCLEHGAYMQLLGELWLARGYLKYEPDRLARRIHLDPELWEPVWRALERFFDVFDGRISQKRLLYELEQARSLRSKRSKSGNMGARARFPEGDLSGKKRSERLAAARLKGTHTVVEWAMLVHEFGGRCVRCGITPDKVVKDHIVPVYQGGSDAIDNLQPLCAKCNHSKGPESTNWSVYRRAHGFEPVGDDDGGGERLAKRLAKRLANVQPPSPSPSPSPPSPEPRSGGDRSPPARPTPSLFDWAMGKFSAAWQRNYGEPYVPTPADRSQLGRMLRSLSPELARALPACFDGYLADRSPFVAQEKRHSLAWFCIDGGVNKYRTKAPVVSAKEARTAQAAARFLEGDGRAGR